MTPDWLARAVSLHATSTGKALLAWLPRDEQGLAGAAAARTAEQVAAAVTGSAPGSAPAES